jgi:hypothetical protein
MPSGPRGERARRPWWRVRMGTALACALLATGLIVVGALVWFRPYLTGKRPAVAEVPTPPALFSLGTFTVPAKGSACMNAITITPQSEVAEFGLRPLPTARKGGPPVDLVLSAPGYHYVLAVPGGYPGGSIALPITPPKRAEIGTACFVNKGSMAVVLPGSTEARTIARSGTSVNGSSVVGDIALSFSQRQKRALADRLGEVFAHASNLTDHLVPTWLIWVLAVLVAFGVPAAVVFALYVALREGEEPATGAS